MTTRTTDDAPVAASAAGLTKPGGVGPAVSTRALTKRYGHHRALDGVELEVPRGVAFGFLGPNGAGKTTIIRLLLSLAWPTSGTVSVLGHPVPGDRRAALAGVGAIIDEPRFHAHLTGRENLVVSAAARGGAARGRIPAALTRVGLAERADDRVGTYSLGMRQRLGIARCLLADPQLLILDEPMNGLDPAGMLEFRALMRSLVQEGRTVFLSSHLLDEVQRTCDLVAIIDGGRVVEQGPIEMLTRGTRRLAVGCNDPGRAAVALRGLRGLQSARPDGEAVEVTLAADAKGSAPLTVERELVTVIVRRLLDAGLTIDRVVPVRDTLEERFLDITTPIEEDR